jgi:DNA-binding NtrC family response regulator
MVSPLTGLDGGGDTGGQPARPAVGPCILVVDDSPAIRRVVARALTEARYSVLEAEDGALALQILERGEMDVDLVLTDIRMPRLGGVELGRRIANRKLGMPVLYMSGGMGDAIVVDDDAGRVLPLLRKPFSLDTLVAIVDRMLPGRRTDRATSKCAPAAPR